MSTSPPLVLSEIRNHVQWIILNRPERRNALNDAVAGEMSKALESAQDDPGGYRAQFIGLVGKVKGM